MSAVLSLDRVDMVFGGLRAVSNVSFEVPVGKLVVLLGPSGCGKSTTLRLIAGLERVSSGRIFISKCSMLSGVAADSVLMAKLSSIHRRT